MNRLILSRKGFDSTSGGSASPIFEDGRFFSIPIPQGSRSPTKYQDLNFDGVSGTDLLNATHTSSVSLRDYCHFDPQLGERIGILGHVGSPPAELRNNEVGPGDLFLFFGWFKNYHNQGDDLHHLFGWLQIEKVIGGSEKIKKFLQEVSIKHPHGYGELLDCPTNTIYVGKRNLDIPKNDTSRRGHGLFKHTHEELILTDLTEQNRNRVRSRWKLPDRYFSNTKNLFLNRLKWQNEESCRISYSGRGQEFILNAEENPKIVDWATHLIQTHG